MINDQNSSIDETPDENIFKIMQDVENNISKLFESIQVIKLEKRTLDEKEDKTPEELTKLSQIQEELDYKLKELSDYLNLAEKMIVKMEEETYNLINSRGSSTQLKQMFQGLTNHPLKSPNDDSTSEFHKVIVLNHDSEMEQLPQLMIFQSMNKFEECQNSCQFYSSCSESDYRDDLSCCFNSSDDFKKDTVPVKSSVSDSLESENLLLKNELCKLKECFNNVFNENQELQSKLRDTVERNKSLAHALKQPTWFKISSNGEIRFPGKKVMEEKLLALKEEIITLNKKVRKQQISQLKLKLAKECIAEFNNIVTHCQCENPKYQDSIVTIIKVKKQKIEHIKLQLNQKQNELIKTTTRYDSSVDANKKIIAKNDKLSECIISLNKKLEEYNSEAATGKQLKDDLIKKAEEIETMKLIIEKRTDEINDNSEKLKKVQRETKKLKDKTNKLENALNNLSEDFDTEYKNLKSNFLEQRDEMMALPILLKMTHIKLQKEIDIRVLAEKTREKLERQIRQAESLKTPNEPEDEAMKLEKENLLISQQLAENQAIESKLKYLKENINSAMTKLNEETGALDAVNQEFQNAMQNSMTQINAFGNFLNINKERLAFDVDRIQKLLMELHGKECEKAVNTKEIMDQLKSYIESIYQKLEECKLEVHTFVYNQWKC